MFEAWNDVSRQVIFVVMHALWWLRNKLVHESVKQISQDKVTTTVRFLVVLKDIVLESCFSKLSL